MANSAMLHIKRYMKQYKNHEKLDFVLEDWQAPDGKLFYGRNIQIRWIEKGKTPNPEDKTLINIVDIKNIPSNIDNRLHYAEIHRI
ncbi:MAG: hypothetical protein WCG95_00755 [bacterium]